MITKDATFSLVVDYDRSHRDGIKVGKFQIVNLDEDGDEFDWGDRVNDICLTGPGKKEVAFRYFYFGRWTGEEEVIAEMEKEGYRPATLKELLAVVEQRPELREMKKTKDDRISLMAFGSDWGPGNCPHCAYACHHHHVASFWINSLGRGMGLFMNRGQGMDPSWYSLGVHK